MTERGQRSTTISEKQFQIGPSGMLWDGQKLTIRVNEMTVPIPGSLKGTIIVDTEFINYKQFQIDDIANHYWQPLCPGARVTAKFDKPDLTWSGNGYLDTNRGVEPLERRFKFWDWSRTTHNSKKSTILYNCDMWNDKKRTISLRFDGSHCTEHTETLPSSTLPPTMIWRMPRRTNSDPGKSVSVIKTLEDTPFYSRSVIESHIFGEKCLSMHESLSGGRFRSPIVKAMLPFRMPRFG